MALSFETFPYRISLRTPLLTARGRIEAREGWLLRVTDGSGMEGWGEASPLDGFVSVEQAAAHAFDEASLDLQASRAGVPVAALLGDGSYADAVEVNALLSATEPEAAAEEARQAAAAGFRCMKLKVGTSPAVQHDLDRVARVREAVGEHIELRVDANGGWSIDLALEALTRLEELGVSLIEQPVPTSDLDGLSALRGKSRLAIAADEAVTDLFAARRIVEAGAVDVLVIKPMRLGGLLHAKAVADVALAAGVGVIVTTSLEGAVGRTGALHLAAAIDADPRQRARLPHGLATGSTLVEDVATGPVPLDGWLRLPAGPGLGVIPLDSNWSTSRP